MSEGREPERSAKSLLAGTFERCHLCRCMCEPPPGETIPVRLELTIDFGVRGQPPRWVTLCHPCAEAIVAGMRGPYSVATPSEKA